MSEINLNEISAADFLAAVEDGIIDLDDMSLESEKVAGDDVDFSEVSTEDLLDALDALDDDNEKVAMLTPKQKKLPPKLQEAIMKKNKKKMAAPAESEKTAEAQYFEDVGRLMARGYADEITKVANGGLDLNELSVDEFIEYAAHLEDEMNKEAMAMMRLTPEKKKLIRKGYHKARKIGKNIITGKGAKKHFSKAREAHKALKQHKEIGGVMVANKHKLHNLKSRTKRGRNVQAMKSGLYAAGTGGLYGGTMLAGARGFKNYKKSRK